MKTSFNLKTPLQRCADSFPLPRLSLFSRAALRLSLFIEGLKKNDWLNLPGLKSLNQKKAHALAVQVAVFLAAIFQARKANARIYFGFGLLGVMAPWAGACYLLFDKTAVDSSWYYTNSFYLFMVLAPFLKSVVEYIGIFLLFNPASKYRYVMAYPIGFALGKIIWLINVQNNAEFHQLEPVSFPLLCMLAVAVFIYVSNYLFHAQFHRADAFDARLNGLAQVADDLPAEKVKSMFLTTWREKKEFQKQY